MKLPTIIQSLLERLVGAFDLAIHAALAAVHNLKITDELQKAATLAVIAAETAGGTGTDKFNAAVASVQKELGSYAIGAIETAVQLAWAAAQSAPATASPAPTTDAAPTPPPAP